ncbi:putative isoamyl alcohol oxidase [Aspergillus ambiguus]|uniref:putative isoamyl alcohol oxidase n=1 Tax=Aspergillus ambiguus TaxID=176160 RepID=UPI003CCCABBD
MIFRVITAALIVGVVSAAILQVILGSTSAAVPAVRCKYIPGDPEWPEAPVWSKLNRTVNGRLIATVPVGSVCHYPDYDEARCNELTTKWGQAQISLPRPAEFLSSYFQNNTCTPFTPSSTGCSLGNYASYSIDVRSIDDVRAGLSFAQQHNIRIVIKNSGHDFYGQSTGKGTLSLWMHNYNETTFIPNYSSSYYNGPALHVQTGVEGAVAGAHASAQGYTVVSGACPTVKMAGGYLAGGGHSYLAGMYGFAADNVLEWEIVTADGERVVATPAQNVDLYWALSGGGAGTYGVVLSATVRVFPNQVTSNAAFSFDVRRAGGVEQYWNAVSTFHQQLKPLLDQGIVAEYGFTNETLVVTGVMALGQTSDSLQASLQPLVNAITAPSVSRLTPQSLGMKLAQADSYFELYRAEIESQLADLVFVPAIAGRFIPRQVMDGDATELDRALRAVADRGFSYAVIALNAINAVRNRTAQPIAPNAVQPNFHRAYSSLMINAQWSNSFPWSEAQRVQDRLMNEVLPIYDAVAPDAGGYKNEANWAEKDIKKAFYAGTYERLEAIKKEVDPSGVFYGITSVGFDWFEFDSDGRLCKA